MYVHIYNRVGWVLEVVTWCEIYKRDGESWGEKRLLIGSFVTGERVNLHGTSQGIMKSRSENTLTNEANSSLFLTLTVCECFPHSPILTTGTTQFPRMSHSMY